jgi:hypothetical protein
LAALRSAGRENGYHFQSLVITVGQRRRLLAKVLDHEAAGVVVAEDRHQHVGGEQHPAPLRTPCCPPPPLRALLLLWLAALGLALIGLGNVPLRDWDEAIVARVSLELSRSPGMGGLLPTYLGEPYSNKPPGLHLAIASAGAHRPLRDSCREM